jgi:hypothetical protein
MPTGSDDVRIRLRWEGRRIRPPDGADGNDGNGDAAALAGRLEAAAAIFRLQAAETKILLFVLGGGGGNNNK